LSFLLSVNRWSQGLSFEISVLFIATILVFAVAPCESQETKTEATSQGTTTIQVQSRLVVLDVVVTGKGGQIRNDLKQGDFRIAEDGVPQTILHFEPPADHELPAGPSIQSTSELEKRAPQAPVTVVVLDELNTRFQDMAYARYALKKYLNAQPGQLQAPTMLVAVSSNRLQVLKDYTQDRGSILSALDHHLTAYPWSLEMGVSRIQQLALSLGALEQVAQATAGHPGHKNLLWVGHGFPGIDLSGPELDQNSIDGITNAVQQGLNMLRDSRITLYTIDPTEMSPSIVVRTDDNSPFGELGDADAPDPFLSDVQFTALAAATGGKAFYSRNDVDKEIGESARDGVNYYTITYRPTSESDVERTYRRIRISLAEPGLHAGSRDGYYTRNEIAQKNNTVRGAYDIDSATENTLVYTGLKVESIAKPNAPGIYLIGIPQQDLAWTDDGDSQTAHAKLVAAVFDPKGKILSRISQNLTERRPLNDSASRSSLARVEVSVPLDPGASRIRFVVWEGTSGHIGTSDLRIPGAPADAAPKR